MHYTDPSLHELASRLETMASNCDPDFDAVYDDLDREFAHLRLHFSDGGTDA